MLLELYLLMICIFRILEAESFFLFKLSTNHKMNGECLEKDLNPC